MVIFHSYVSFLLVFQRVLKAIVNQPIFDGLYNQFMVNRGMVYVCFNHITDDNDSWYNLRWE